LKQIGEPFGASGKGKSESGNNNILTIVFVILGILLVILYAKIFVFGFNAGKTSNQDVI